MRQLRCAFFILILCLAVQACGPDQPAEQAVSANVADLSTATPDPSDLIVEGTLQPVPPALPPMEVGSLYRYFDGALLDAVPDRGPFLMGDGLQFDDLQHAVTVSDFWIYSVEVTNQMYAWCVKVGKCTPPDPKDNPSFDDAFFGSYPVVGVNWQQASDYCSFAHARLPTEAEWEKAASWDDAAKVKRLYPWGDKRASCDILNFRNCLGRTAPVLQFGRGQSYYGVFNMSGNVFEWVADWYKPDYYASSPSENPRGPGAGIRRSIRSGGFSSDAFLTQPSRRFSAQPSEHRNDLGFRCVVDDPAYFAPFCVAPVFYGLNPDSVVTPSARYDKPCPDPILEHYDGCSVMKEPVSFVRVRNTPPTIVTVTGLEGCTPNDNELGVTHQCSTGLTIRVEASCNLQPAGSPACPPNFLQDPQDPSRCLARGRAGACPTGYAYDSSLQCCTQASANSAPFPLCSVGEHLYNGICVDDNTGPWPPLSLVYTTSSGLDCTPGSARP